MLDRLTNLLVLLVAALALAAFGVSWAEAWNSTNPWEEEWRPIVGKPALHAATDITNAIKNATGSNSYADANSLRQYLEANYERTGSISVRISAEETMKIFAWIGATLLLLFIPVAINYVRHGRFRIWNRQQAIS